MDEVRVDAMSSWDAERIVCVVCVCVRCAGPKSGDMMTRKRAKLSTKDERPKKKTNGQIQAYTRIRSTRTVDGRLEMLTLLVVVGRLGCSVCAVKGIRYTLTSEEISSDLESVRSLMSGLGGSTRSKAKGH